MKNQWNQFPFVLRRKILLTFLSGLASIALSLIIFIITTDHILLVLGSIIFLASLVLVRSLWSTIARGQYEIVEGVCSSVISPVIRRYRKIQLIDGQGAERTLLLSKSAKFQIGARYRFYFQTGSRPVVGNDYLDAALSTNSFLGYEALGEPAVPEEQATLTRAAVRITGFLPLILGMKSNRSWNLPTGWAGSITFLPSSTRTNPLALYLQIIVFGRLFSHRGLPAMTFCFMIGRKAAEGGRLVYGNVAHPRIECQRLRRFCRCAGPN